jgi:hypothetical protein
VRAEGLEEAVAHEHRTVVVDDGIADVGRDRIGAVIAPDRGQTFRHEVEGFLPGDRLEVAVGAAPNRRAQAVGVVVHGRHRHALGADEALRRHVVVIGTHRDDAFVALVAGHFEGQAAGGLAERAASVDRSGWNAARAAGGFVSLDVGRKAVEHGGNSLSMVSVLRLPVSYKDRLCRSWGSQLPFDGRVMRDLCQPPGGSAR